MNVLSNPSPANFPNAVPGQQVVRTVTLVNVVQDAPVTVGGSVVVAFKDAEVSVPLSASFDSTTEAPVVTDVVLDVPGHVTVEVSEPVPLAGFTDRWAFTITYTTV